MTATAAVPTGNTYDKYGSTNPVVRRLMAGFEAALDDLLALAGPRTIVDVGCGEGVLCERWAARPAIEHVTGVDLADPALSAEWAARTGPKLDLHAVPPGPLPFPDSSADLATAIEVLEHVPDPAQTLAEMARVARRHLLVSVPHEPLWRALNLARGAYVRQLGNTPGHVNHWSRRGFARLVARFGTVVELRTPFPWTMALVRVG